MAEAERDRVAREIVGLAAGQVVEQAFLDAVIDWHLTAVQAAESEAWLPGGARSSDPVVEELIRRFYLHGFRENMIELQRKVRELADERRNLVESLRFYSAGVCDGGKNAISALERAGARASSHGAVAR
jgi:hypothetical protein